MGSAQGPVPVADTREVARCQGPCPRRARSLPRVLPPHHAECWVRVLVSACSRVCVHPRASARVCARVCAPVPGYVFRCLCVSPCKCLCRCWERGPGEDPPVPGLLSASREQWAPGGGPVFCAGHPTRYAFLYARNPDSAKRRAPAWWRSTSGDATLEGFILRFAEELQRLGGPRPQPLPLHPSSQCWKKPSAPLRMCRELL